MVKNSETFEVINIHISKLDEKDILKIILRWAKTRQSKSIFAANVHMVMEAYDNPEYRKIVNSSDIVVPDGKPLPLLIKLITKSKQKQIRGPELMLKICALAQRNKLSVGFYGSTHSVLSKLLINLRSNYPEIIIKYAYSPPFRPLSSAEHKKILCKINSSDIDILFVSLGCPKQEVWIHEQKNIVKSVMFGVGQAFNIHARKTTQAPYWMQVCYLEWLFRFINDPKRLFNRYAKNNHRFIILAIRQLLQRKIN